VSDLLAANRSNNASEDMQVSEPESVHDDFYLLEYKALRSEIENMLKDARSVERNVALSVGAIWAWLAVQPTAVVPKQVWLLPVLLVVLGAYRSSALLKTFGVMSLYIQKMEKRFCDNEIEGWENFSNPRRAWMSKSGGALWAVLLVTSIGIATYKWTQC
jgi:hypothetical protein